MYGHEKAADPAFVNSRTGYSITAENLPVLCQSKLQTETTILTVEAEITAMSHSRRGLFPIMDMVNLLGHSIVLPIGDATINVSMHEDNSGTLVLAEILPPHFTPRSKHYATKIICFRAEIFKTGIKLVKIDTIRQLGGFFTKRLLKAKSK